MGVAYFVSLEQSIPGYEHALEVSGKSVARAMEDLNKLCERLGLVPLMDFYSESLKEQFDHIGEPVPDDMPDQPITWTEPKEGLRTVEGLIDYLRGHPAEMQENEHLLRDLADFCNVLLKAQEHGTKFRLCIDM